MEFVVLIVLSECTISTLVGDVLAVSPEEITCLVSGLLKLMNRSIIKIDSRIYIALITVEAAGDTDLGKVRLPVA